MLQLPESEGPAEGDAYGRPVSVSVSFSRVHDRSGATPPSARHEAGPSMNAGERPRTQPTTPPPQLESVLGSHPHEFESRILRQCLTGHDVEGPHRSRWGPSSCLSALLVLVFRPQGALRGQGDACPHVASADHGDTPSLNPAPGLPRRCDAPWSDEVHPA
jgi:hypothetical protein